MSKIILLSLSFLSFPWAHATGANTPKGYWSCSYSGSEWQMVPGPQGTSHYEMRPTIYGSGWKKSKSDANDQALSDCQNWSDTGCRFVSCRQK